MSASAMAEVEAVVGVMRTFQTTDMGTKTFKFDPDIIVPFDSEPCWCEITIAVEKKTYESGKAFYNIKYVYKYSDYKNLYARKCNPLKDLDDNDYDSDEDEDLHAHYEGEIVKVNSLTEQMVKFLLMDFDDLEGHCGNTTPEVYKSIVMHALNLFWD